MSGLADRRRLLPHLAPWDEMRAGFAWDIPERFNIATACCDDWAGIEPGRTAIIDLAGGERRVWTFADLKAASDALAGALSRRGVGRGDRVAILLAQRAEVMVAHLATMKLGAVSLPLFALFGPEALEYRLRDSGARAVVSDAAGLEKVGTLDLPDLALRIDADAWADLLSEAPAAPVETAAEDPAMMIYTSGTTGPPKGVLHAHRFLLGHMPCVETSLEGFPQDGDVAWTPADWAWIGGLMDLAFPALWFGVPLVAKRFAKFDADTAWALMRDERVTCAFLPPTALKMLRRTDPPEGLSLRAVMSGGEALGAGLLAWGRDALGVAINEIYGQTECNLVMASCAGTQDVVPGSLGRAVPGVEVTLRDADGREVAEGEICVRGSPATFLGYWGKPEKTAEKWHGPPPETWRDGWLRTGDLGRREGEVISYVSRDDDVISSAGYRIGPTEIETCLTAHPQVVMCAVVGLPDETRGEAVTAFVVAEGATEGLEDDLIAWVRARLSPHMAPRAVRFVPALPMTATGKVQRRALREA
ncbi:AMP-binding protein [Jannaschia seohaensis]|uniref:Acetyl-CoA synthetase n=1 Tax=Jannaschia seohaensis TaxID=475081 RepID=A0A2Y9C914_9RHOB|nr:AMP-binding protein [Jannaschia seohaensis]PWJ12522.1 acetyl-CoA synthetase [Jannaschia seohaensis]SSA51003.1 acetyl-CoA synthetase [Jannaschia seohaensis]